MNYSTNLAKCDLLNESPFDRIEYRIYNYILILNGGIEWTYWSETYLYGSFYHSDELYLLHFSSHIVHHHDYDFIVSDLSSASSENAQRQSNYQRLCAAGPVLLVADRIKDFEVIQGFDPSGYFFTRKTTDHPSMLANLAQSVLIDIGRFVTADDRTFLSTAHGRPVA